jgi:hypothetical protein
LQGGLSLSIVSNQDPDDSWRRAFAGYTSISIRPDSLLIVELQIGYAMKGFQRQGEWNEVDSAGNSMVRTDKFSYRYDYFEIPLLVKYLILRTKPVQFSICAGPYISYLSSAKGSLASRAGPTDGYFDLKNGMDLFDAGITLGAGLQKPMGSGRITFEIRSSSGLASPLKNQSFYFLLGYEYRL